MGLRGAAAHQWDVNIDALVRKLDGHGILFAQPHLWNDIEYDKNKNALATARNTIAIMRMVRICLRISDAYTQLRCYKLSCWQPYDCVECDVGFWMPHGTDLPVMQLRETDFVNDDAWQQPYKDLLLVPCKPFSMSVLTSLYRRQGICANHEDLIPFVKAKHRRYVLACFERDSRLMDLILARHDTLFTLASYFQIPADHGIINILHQYLKVESESSAGEDGIENTRALDQLVGATRVVFKDKCSMMKFLIG